MASSGSGIKRKCLSFETKLKVIEEVEKGLKTKADICREYNILISLVGLVSLAPTNFAPNELFLMAELVR